MGIEMSFGLNKCNEESFHEFKKYRCRCVKYSYVVIKINQ